YTQENGIAGRDGSRSKDVLYYNTTDLAQRYVDWVINDILKSIKYGRLFLSGYFNVNFQPATVQDCCDGCANYQQTCISK
ncbi:hypothetical protein ACJMK2_029028, partial [Sinanodonta woodiana]